MALSGPELEDLLFDPNISDIELDIEEDEEFAEEPPLQKVDDLETTEIEPTTSTLTERADPHHAAGDRINPNRWRHKIDFDAPIIIDAADRAPVNAEVRKPMEYFCRYLDFDFFVELADYTNRRSVEELGKSLDCSTQEMCKFWGASIVAALLQYPRLRMCWESRTRYPLIADNITRDRFFTLRNKIKIVDDNAVPLAEKTNPYWKVQPMLDRVRKGCLENVRPENISIDEQMIPFHGKVQTRQYVRGKPNPVGMKNFVATTPSGLPLDFMLYNGKGAEIISEKIPPPEKIDLGGRVVLKLSDSLPECSSLFIDRYFTSVSLLDYLLKRNIYATGTIMFNRLPKNIEFIADKDLRKNRGSFDQLVRIDRIMNIVKWFDNKSIFLCSTKFGVEPVEDCRRWSKSTFKFRAPVK